MEEAKVDSLVISKEDLYNNYSEHKDIYEFGQNNVEQAARTTESYEEMKDEMQ